LDYERLFLDHLGLIEGVLRFVARRHHLSSDEAEDLASGIKLKIIENEYQVLRKFEGRSSFRTNLTAIVQRHFLDERAARWGKWRPSMQARRLGPVAVHLDQLLTRDGLSFDEAVELLRTNHGVTLSRQELYAISQQLPTRAARHFVGDASLAALPGPTETDLDRSLGADEASEADRIEIALRAALAQLTPEDRLLLKMRFQDGVQVSKISKLLAVDQKPLYRRLDRIMDLLRAELEKRGVARELIADIVGQPAFEMKSVFENESAKNLPRRPSTS
jgi:RNA polymerase sigma factor (sigma-70 family)